MSQPPASIGLTREAWGPRFWKILHTLAECSGYQTNQIMNNDEADAWIIFLKSQAFVMPCPLCKQHYLEWYGKHKPDNLRTILGEQRRKWLREWLWGCHDRVNQMNEKTSPSIDTMNILYSKQSIDKEARELFGMFQLAIIKQQLKYEDISRWKNVLLRLRIIYGI